MNEDDGDEDDGKAMGDMRFFIATKCEEIAARFKGPVRMTVLVRSPNHPDGSRDALVTNDTPSEILAAIALITERGLKH